jgi:hypothetical protein
MAKGHNVFDSHTLPPRFSAFDSSRTRQLTPSPNRRSIFGTITARLVATSIACSERSPDRQR